MFVQVKNEDYGYAVATYGDYVAVSNPDFLRYDAASASVYHTGSVDFFRYNKSTDSHDYVNTIYNTGFGINVTLETELTNSITYDIEVESASIDIASLLIDKDRYTASVEDGFGISLDMYGKLLVIGSPHATSMVFTNATTITASGASVDIHDFGRTEFIPLSQSSYVFTLLNPVANVTNSFGTGVSINSTWIAVGSPYVSSSQGVVYMYRNTSTGSNYSWSFFQTIEPSGSLSDALFGWDLKLNKQSGSVSQSLVVGCGNSANGQAYYFEFVSGSWSQTFTFVPNTDILPLTFGGYMPYNPTSNISNGFGYAVSTFDETVVVGAPFDRLVYEFSGSALYEQGSVYVFEKCLNVPYTLFQLVLKTYGTDLTMKNNRMGYSVDIFNNNAIVGIPKTNNNSMTACYVAGTIEQLHQCTNNLENSLNGQAMLLQKNTESMDWEITNVYQKKKKYLSPYRDFGNDVSIADRSMVVGAPMLLSDSIRQMDIATTQSNNISLDDIMGKAYIYNLKNLRDQFHVGNVFYRNGKIVIMTSGSVFDGLFFNPVNTSTYEYDLQFKGQHTIFEKQVVCTVNPGEFNVSTNPSAVYKPTASLDINGNGQFDFQDADIILRYMQYKNTSFLGLPVSTDWSSSIVKRDDEISFLNYNQDSNTYNNEHTSYLTSESIVRWEQVDTWMQDVLDLNEDNRIDIRDMNIVWKYFANRLTQENYATYITPSCQKKLFSDVIDYMNFVSQKTANAQINPQFMDYERSVALDKTGSFLAPMATTIGLYSGLDLVGVAKLGTPIKIIPELPINFVVKMDY